MKIGLYGGSFNPVHDGHVAVVKEVLGRKLVDQVWIVPCKNHAFKKGLASVCDRLNMLNYAFSGMKNVRIDMTEIDADKINYTSETLETFKKNYHHNFYLIAGVDALNDLNSWHNAAYLKENAEFIAVHRNGYELNNDVLHIMSGVIPSVSDLSSTQIRDRIECGKSIDGMVNKEVAKYINDNNLYKPVFRNPSATVDMICHSETEYGKGIVLIKRKYEPFKDHWALPGGYLEYGKETLEEAAVRELGEETSLIADVSDLRLVAVKSDPKRDPRGHVISHVYEVKKFSGTPRAKDDAIEIGVFTVLPKDLAFDHAQIISEYYRSKKYDDLLKK